MRRNVPVLLIALAVAGALPGMAARPAVGQGDSPATSTPAAPADSQSELGLLTGTPEAAPSYASIHRSRTVDGAFLLGDPNAPVTVVEFGDFACQLCQTYKPTIDRFIENYVVPGKAAFEFRLYPSTGGALSARLSQYAECADQQQPGAFWDSYELLYQLAENGGYDQTASRTLAARLKLDAASLRSCARQARQVFRDIALGYALHVAEAPAILVQYGDQIPEFIRQDGQTYDQGTVPYSVLERALLGNGPMI